jgi:MFS family permease
MPATSSPPQSLVGPPVASSAHHCRLYRPQTDNGLAILAYSLTTALSAVAWNWQSFAILRFLVGVGIGSEWVTGASLVSELWPDHARGKGGGLLQSGAGIGSFLASAVWLLIGGFGPGAWR